MGNTGKSSKLARLGMGDVNLDQVILGEKPITKENTVEITAAEESTTPKTALTDKEEKGGLQFHNSTGKSKKSKGQDQIKDRVTIVVSEATRKQLNILCAKYDLIAQNWVDETLWKAIDRYEKAQIKK